MNQQYYNKSYTPRHHHRRCRPPSGSIDNKYCQNPRPPSVPWWQQSRTVQRRGWRIRRPDQRSHPHPLIVIIIVIII